LKQALAGWQRGIWTALPGIITAFNESDNTVDVQPAIKATVVHLDRSTGAQKPVETNLPLLIKVPLHQIGGGGFVVDIKPAAGDEVTVLFASRCIDGWWQSGGVQSQMEKRTHDLSDGIAIPGLFSANRASGQGLMGGGLKVRSLDGQTSIHLAGGGVINITAPGGLNIHANVNITGTVINNGHAIDSTHRHTNVQPGGSLSGVPQ
jgi:hypothetical protein